MTRRTIAREVSLEGVGLHEGLPTRLRLRPAAPGTGVRFRRVDLPGSEPVPVHFSAREERARRTAIVRGPSEVHTVEHLMAAVAGLGISDLDAEIDRVEVPGMDGSAADFLRALREAGFVDLPGEAPVLTLDRVVTVAEEKPASSRTEGTGARIVALPCPGRLVLEYHLDYGGDCPPSRVEIDVTEESFARELSGARTFCLEKEAAMLRAAGLGRGASTRNTLVIGKDGKPLENELRFPDEYARHKALDLLGDLTLLGARLEARVIAYKAGHALNAALCRELAKLLPGAAAAAAPGGLVTPPPEAFAGHFPGDPVLPGVAMLALLRGRDAIAGIEGAKFRRVVRPGEAIALEREEGRGGRVRAKVRAGGEVAVDVALVRAEGEGA